MIKTHIERHTRLMRTEVRMEELHLEHDMRLKELQHFKDTERSRRQQEYNAIKANVNPATYDDRLDGYHSHVCEGTGKWLLEDSVFKRWLDQADQTTRVLWIQGIPGAGGLL